MHEERDVFPRANVLVRTRLYVYHEEGQNTTKQLLVKRSHTVHVLWQASFFYLWKHFVDTDAVHCQMLQHDLKQNKNLKANIGLMVLTTKANKTSSEHLATSDSLSSLLSLSSSSSPSIPKPRGLLGHHKWFYNQLPPFSSYKEPLKLGSARRKGCFSTGKCSC